LLGPGHHYIGYRAHDAVENTVALKVLLSGREKNRADERAMMERIGGVRHSHLAEVRGMIELPEVLALVTDYVDGPSMRRWLGSYRPTPDEILSLFKAILGGVSALHDADVVHGAINPGNVMLAPTNDGLVTKVTDYGEQRIPDAMSMYAARYLAPEVLQNGRGDAASDIWSLGAVLYELAAGKPPFDATDLALLEEAVVERRAPPLEVTALGLPEALGQVVMECLQKNPALRPQTCDELSEKLYGNTIVKRIEAAQGKDEAAELRGTVRASNVGLAVARALGPGEGNEPPEARENASVEAVARRSYRPKPAPPEDQTKMLMFAASFMVLGALAVLCSGGILLLVIGS